MHERKPNRPEPFHLIAQRIVDEKKRTSTLRPKEMAGMLNVSHQTLLRWLRNGKYHMPAEKLPEMCRILGNFELLDALEEQAGRVAFPKPDMKEPPAAEEVVAVQRLVKEVGEALQSLANTLEDHVVEEWEVENTLPKLDDVIRECLRLEYWLRARSRVDREKSKSRKLSPS
jgi:transcriptional regulator with XRE-family HTH domain